MLGRERVRERDAGLGLRRGDQRKWRVLGDAPLPGDGRDALGDRVQDHGLHRDGNEHCQPAEGGDGFGGIPVHDHGQSPSQMRDLPDAARRCRQGGSGMREEIHSMQQGERVGASRLGGTPGVFDGRGYEERISHALPFVQGVPPFAGRRQGPDDPGVAALFLGFMKLAPRPPDDGMPPIDGHHGHLEEPHPMIAAAQVG